MLRKLMLLVVFMFAIPYAFGGETVDRDGDGLFCVVEDDGVYCNEDGQDRCDGIPNVSLDDHHCSMDFNGDGLFTLVDVAIIQAQYDHPLGSGNYGGNACFGMMRIVEYNKRLSTAGLQPLQLDQPFIVVGAGAHCFGHHVYPAIE